MGASIYIHWPGCSREQEGDHPGFGQDDHAYATWVTAVLENPSATLLLKAQGLDALLSVGDLGQREGAMHYTTPSELRDAATRLQSALRQRDPTVLPLVDLYKHGPGEESREDELAYDLGDVVAIADHASVQGARQLTLLVGW